MKKIANKILDNWSLILGIVSLFFVNTVLVLQNHTPNTWLTGWDNLHPEFNFGLNIDRSLSALWQEYQGLGLLGGMAHAADLPRQLFLAFSSVVIPQSDLRYFWVFLMLFFGSTGAFVFARFLGLGVKENSKHIVNLAALVAALFYVLNLATVQVYFTPFETFVGFFGFLPWLLYFGVKYLQVGKRRNLLGLFLITIAASGAFYVQTMFVVFMMIFAIFVLEAIVRHKKAGIKRSILAFVTILCASAFWLLPVGYFTLSGANVVAESKINSIATVETKLMNQASVSLENLALLKGFWFDYIDIDKDGNYLNLYSNWKPYVENDWVGVFGLILFGLAIVGIISSIFFKENKWRLALPLGFLICFLMIAIGTQLLSGIPIIGEAFRSVFTKWSTATSLFYGLGLGFFVLMIASKFKLVGAGIASVAIVFMTAAIIKPAFQGELISQSVRIDIPKSYFQLFDYFDSQPKDARIAFLPAQTFWGWNSYNWGYRGSGFLWYGIKQPILDRAFDVWSPNNETFYTEFSHALYADDAELVSNVIKKYDVRYVLFDKNVVAPKGQEGLLLHQKAEKLLGENAKLVFEKDRLLVYDLSTVAGDNGFIKAAQSFTAASGDVTFGRTDQIFAENGVYVGGSGQIYPFSGLTKETAGNVEFEDNKLVLENHVNTQNSKLTIPAFPDNKQIDIPVKVAYSGREVSIELNTPYEIEIDGKKLDSSSLPTLYMTTNKDYDKVVVGINSTNFEINQGQNISDIINFVPSEPLQVNIFDATNGGQITIDPDFDKGKVNNCWTRDGQKPFLESNFDNGVLTMTTKDAVGCVAYKIGVLGQAKTQVNVALPYKSTKGSRPDFCVVEEGSSKCLHDDIFYHSNSSSDWSSVSRNLTLNPNINYWIILSGRPSDTKNETWSIDYKVPQISYYPQVAGYEFKPETWSEFFEEKTMNVANSKEIKVSFAAKENLFELGKDGLILAKNCDIFERGSVAKIINGGSVTYSAINHATACDYMTLDNVNSKNEFILRFAGVNKTGRSPKFYLYNKANQRNDIENLLGGGEFDNYFSILSWNNFEENEYVLNLETRAFGSSETINTLDQVSGYNLPISWLISWKFVPMQNTVFQNGAKVNNQTHPNTFWYKANIDSSGGNSLVILSQGYDKGWWASNGVKVKVNNWANGWILPSGATSLTIIYLPQYLQFIGFGIGILCLILIIIRPRVLKNIKVR